MINTKNTGKEVADVTSSLLEDEAKKLPDKSRSLRARSIQKRLETERHKNFPKASIAEQHHKDTIQNVSSSQSRSSNSRTKNRGVGRFGSGSTTMSKYRRKTANAKERDRMKTVNEAFERLKDVVPVDELLEQQQAASVLSSKETQSNTACEPLSTDGTTGKDLILGLVNPLKSTKVSTLRCAIEYINALQKLIEDSEKGILDPSFYENDEDDNDEDIDMILERHMPFNGDNNNNRDKKKKGNQSRRRKDKRDIKGKKYLSNKKMSMIASSLNKNLSVKKMSGRIKIHESTTGANQVDKDLFDVKKMLKMGNIGSTCHNPEGKRHDMNIINASIPQIMDIIRNATTKHKGAKAKTNRKKSKLTNGGSRSGNNSKLKSRNGKFLQLQKRTENIPQLLRNATYSYKKAQQEQKHPGLLTVGANGCLEPILSSQQRPLNVINNVQYIQPIGEYQGIKDSGLKAAPNLQMLVSSSLHAYKSPQLKRNKFSGGLSNNLNISNTSCIQNFGGFPATNVCEKDSIFMSSTNKLSPPQVKKLLSSLSKLPMISEPLMHTSPPPTVQTQSPPVVSSISPSLPFNSTILLSPPPSNSSSSNYSCDETSTSSTFDDVNTTNSNVDSSIDASSCLISPSLNSFLSSSSLHTSMPCGYQSTVGPSGLNTSATSSISPTPSSSSSEVQLMNCSNTSTTDILDDIQQVLKDAENFDILFAQ